MSEDQDYTYTPNPEGRTWKFKQDRNGRWRELQPNPETGRWNMTKGGCGVVFGRREKYHDFSF